MLEWIIMDALVTIGLFVVYLIVTSIAEALWGDEKEGE